MADYNDNIFDEFDEKDEFTPEPVESPEEATGPSGNKPPKNTFMIIVSIFGAIFLLALIALIVYAVIIIPQRNASRTEEAAQINAQNTATSVFATEYAYAQQLELTPSSTPLPTNTLQPTATPVVVFATETQASGIGGPDAAADDALNARTATVAALLTMAAGGTSPADLTATPVIGAGTAAVTPTVLPTTGFADEVGLPGLFGIAALLLAVIVLSRRLRTSVNS